MRVEATHSMDISLTHEEARLLATIVLYMNFDGGPVGSFAHRLFDSLCSNDVESMDVLCVEYDVDNEELTLALEE